MPETTAKICAVCGQDCAGRPRVKDKRGRYLCKSCDERRAPGQAPASPEDGALDLAPDDGPAPSLTLCPGCGAAIAPDAATCLRCGYDQRTGLRPSATDDTGQPVRTCSGCGYNLAGLKAWRCPECGKPTMSRPGRADRAPAPTGWATPVVLIAVGLILTAALQIPFDRSGATFIRSLLGLALKIPVAVIAYAIAGLFWMGFDMPWRHVWLRYAAVCAIGTLVGVPVGYIPFIFAQAGIMIFVYFGLIAALLDVDVQDAILIASITVVGNLILVQAALIAVLGA